MGYSYTYICAGVGTLIYIRLPPSHCGYDNYEFKYKFYCLLLNFESRICRRRRFYHHLWSSYIKQWFHFASIIGGTFLKANLPGYILSIYKTFVTQRVSLGVISLRLLSNTCIHTYKHIWRHSCHQVVTVAMVVAWWL